MSDYIKGTSLYRVHIDEPTHESCDTCGERWKVGDTGIGSFDPQDDRVVFAICSRCVRKAAVAIKLPIQSGCQCGDCTSK